MHAGSKRSFRASRKMKSDNSKIRTTIYGSRGLVEARSITRSDSVTNVSSAFSFFLILFFFYFRVQCFSFSPTFLFLFSPHIRLARYSLFMVTDSCIVINHISTVFCFHDRAEAGLHPVVESSARSRSFSLDVVPSARRDAAEWPTDARCFCTARSLTRAFGCGWCAKHNSKASLAKRITL